MSDCSSPGVIPDNPEDCRLWVVTNDAVLHAPEKCDFAGKLGASVVKHSNLTGGGCAYCGGEFLFVTESCIVMNGCSGRYRIETSAEMGAIEKAFKSSGYDVWSMGFDDDTNQPRPFGRLEPTRVRL